MLHFFGIWCILYGLAINSFIELFLNGFYLKKEINYGTWDQIKDFLPSLFLSLIASIATYLFMCYVNIVSNLITLILTFVVFLLLYLLGAYTMKLEALKLARKVALGMFKK